MLEKRCPHCLSSKITPKGWNRKHTKHRYYCKGCDARYVEGGKDYFIDEEKVSLIDRLLLERLSLRGICRAVRISLTWLMSYVKRRYEEVPDDLYFKPVVKTEQVEGREYIRLIKSELDEMWTGPPGGFVGKRKNKRWIWLAQ